MLRAYFLKQSVRILFDTEFATKNTQNPISPTIYDKNEHQMQQLVGLLLCVLQQMTHVKHMSHMLMVSRITPYLSKPLRDLCSYRTTTHFTSNFSTTN